MLELFWIIAAPFMAVALVPWLRNVLRGLTGYALALVPAGIVWVVAGHLPLEPDTAPSLVWPWLPELGVQFALRMDGLSALFVLMIAGIGALILIYAGGYMGSDPRAARLYGLLLAFMGSMLGVVLSDDLITLFVFWELTSITSFLLIGFNHEQEKSRASALQALLVTGGGGLALLAGLILLNIAAATADGAGLTEFGRISAILSLDLRAHPLYPAALVLILLGAFTKSAQFPFHFWLPNAMTAPTPVSAYLHSATMVKAGVFLLARLQPGLGDTLLWTVIVTSVGAITMLSAAAMSAGQRDLKRILAYTTVSVLGTLTMLIGLGTDAALKAAVVFVAAHALYKCALFMVAGSIDHETGTRDVTRLGGLFGLMPVTALAALLAALSQAGAPPMFGFIGKELLLKAKLDLEWVGALLILVAVLTNIFLIAMALVVAVWPFYGRRLATPKHAHEAPLAMLIGPVVLSVCGLFVGLFPAVFDQTLGPAAVSAIAGHVVAMELHLWHGMNPAALTALAISAVTLVLGFVLFARLHHFFEHLVVVGHRIERAGPARGYELALAGVLQLAAGVTGLLQSGHLRRYVMVVVLVLVALLCVPVVRSVPAAFADELWSIYWHEATLAVVALLSAAFATRSRSRLSAVAFLGVTGVSIALLFALLSAPDLAITLVMVEILTVILFVFVFYHLPQLKALRTPRERARDALYASAAGLVMTLLVLASTAVPLDSELARYYAQNSKPAAYGRNIVNVILVDFRALDTLGEVTVLAVAAIGVFALLRLRRRTRRASA